MSTLTAYLVWCGQSWNHTPINNKSVLSLVCVHVCVCVHMHVCTCGKYGKLEKYVMCVEDAWIFRGPWKGKDTGESQICSLLLNWCIHLPAKDIDDLTSQGFGLDIPSSVSLGLHKNTTTCFPMLLVCWLQTLDFRATITSIACLPYCIVFFKSL